MQHKLGWCAMYGCQKKTFLRRVNKKAEIYQNPQELEQKSFLKLLVDTLFNIVGCEPTKI